MGESMEYEEIVTAIMGRRRFGKACGRQVAEELLARLNCPERGMRVIHIAGTNGKGSTAAFVSSILQAAGFCVGQFTSPHLVDFTERIQVNGRQISREDAARLGQRLLDLPMELECTMFDLCLGMALLYFRERRCDFVVLETGLGGRLDSTSGLSQVPLVSVVTNIGLDHVQILGDTLEEIAAEKAGIFKRGRRRFRKNGRRRPPGADQTVRGAGDSLAGTPGNWKSGSGAARRRSNPVWGSSGPTSARTLPRRRRYLT